MKKSLTLNTILYTLKSIFSIVYPLITFPYISRVLSAEGVGQYSFSNSVVSYFLLIAALGTSTYAIREGAKIRDDREKFQKFAQEIFSINIISMLVSLTLLFLVVQIPKLKSYENIILILAIAIPLTTIGTEWIFNIYEDFAYITIRSMAFQCLSLVGLLIFVKDANDVWKYAVTTVTATAGSNVLNYKKAKKYFKHKIIINKKLIKHIKPVFILFAAAVASQIYINADITMLGLMQGDYATGMYSAASKIYNILRTVLTAAIAIIMPRIAYLKDNNKEGYSSMLSGIFNLYVFLVIPCCIGVLLIADEVLLLLCGVEFLDAGLSLKILAIALIFSTLGSFIANVILVVHSEEKTILAATCIGATLNIIGNIFLIKEFSYVGAALTTLMSELIVFIIQSVRAQKYEKISGAFVNLIKVLLGVLLMSVIHVLIPKWNGSALIEMSITVISSVIIYIISMLCLKQESIVLILKSVCSRKKDN